MIVPLGPGDALVCFTDGVTEGRGPEGMFGDERPGRRARRPAQARTRRASPTGSSQAALDFQGGRTQDDLALLVLRVPGET